jgi:hypothetical protein
MSLILCFIGIMTELSVVLILKQGIDSPELEVSSPFGLWSDLLSRRKILLVSSILGAVFIVLGIIGVFYPPLMYWLSVYFTVVGTAGGVFELIIFFGLVLLGGYGLVKGLVNPVTAVVVVGLYVFGIGLVFFLQRFSNFLMGRPNPSFLSAVQEWYIEPFVTLYGLTCWLF